MLRWCHPWTSKYIIVSSFIIYITSYIDKSIPSACGACISLGMLSAAAKYFDDHADLIKQNETIRETLKPVLMTDVPDINPKPSGKKPSN